MPVKLCGKNTAGPKMKLFVALSLLSSSYTLIAAEYSVDQNHPKAGDKNPGTKDAPLKTISAAAKIVKPGDTVTVAPGIYRETVELTVSGSNGAPIIFRSREPLQAVICGSDVITEWRPAGPGIWVTDVPDLPPLNKYAKPHHSHGGEWVYVDGSPLQYSESGQLQMPGTFRVDFDAKKLYVAPEEGRTPENALIEHARRQGLFHPAAPLDDIHILGFTLIHNADWISSYRPPVLAKGRRWLIADNHIAWSSSSGIMLNYTSDAIVRGNLIEWAGLSGMGGSWGQRMLIESNRVRYCNWRRNDPSSIGTGGSKWAMTYDSITCGNVFSFNYGSGLWFDWGNCNNVNEKNICHDNSAWGLFSECNWDEIFRGNVSFNNSLGLVIAESPACVVFRNICFNNDYGIMIRGEHTRSGGAGYTPEKESKLRGELKKIPDIAPSAHDRIMAGWIKYHLAVSKFMSNSSVLWENLLFNNEAAIWEARDYAAPSALDPFVNNLSDRNLFQAPKTRVGSWDMPVIMKHRAGGYATLKEWTKVSGRDANSKEIDILSSKDLPAWAEEKRAIWEIPMRRRPEIRSLGLVAGTSACIAWGRWLRSPTLEELPLKDSQVKAYFLEVDGQKTLMLWTCHEMARRYVRLYLEQNEIEVENGYLRGCRRALPGHTIDIVVNWLPTCLKGIKGAVREVPSPMLNLAPFNPPDKPVNVTMTFPNTTDAPLQLDGKLSVSKGFSVEPGRLSRTVAAGETGGFQAQLIPDGSFRSGAGMIRLEAKMGEETINRIALFSIGEAGGEMPMQSGPIKIDGKLDDWKCIAVNKPPLGLIGDKGQVTQDDKKKAWGGVDDLSGKIYAVWSPEAIYIAAMVKDDKVIGLPAPANPWDGDCVEVFLDGRSGDMQWQEMPTEGCFQIGVAPGTDPAKPNVATWSQSAPRPLPGLEVAAATNEAGFIVEMKIPLTLRNFPAGEWKAGRPIKLSVLLYDRDDPGSSYADYTIGWAFSPGGANFRDTSGWRTLILAGKPE